MSKLRRIARIVGLVMLSLLLGLAGMYGWVMHTGISSWGLGAGTEPYTFYPTAAQLSDRILALAGIYPNLITVQTIGDTLQGKPILGVTIAAPGGQAAGERPALLVVAQQHGREAIASQVALYSIESLLEDYDTDPLVKHLLQSRTIYYVPQANPDGNDIFLTEDSSHRGNARTADLDGDGLQSEDGRDDAGAGTYTRYVAKFTSEWIRDSDGQVFRNGWSDRDASGKHKYARGYWTLGTVTTNGSSITQLDNDGDGKVNEDDLLGIDPNRNWDLEWEQGVSDPKSMTYRGGAPFSEPETAAIRDFVLEHPNIITAVEFHSGTEVILMPWSKTRDELPPDMEMLDQLARKSSQLTESPHAVAGQGLYLAYGTIKDWLYSQGILTLVPEVYGGPFFSGVRRLWPTNFYVAYGSSAQQFNPPPRDIKQHAERWRQMVPYLLSSLPEPYVTDIRLNGQALSLEVGNAGFINSSLRLSIFKGNQQLFSRSWPSISAHAETVSIAGVSDGTYRLVLSSQPDIQVKEHQPQQLVIDFQINNGGIGGLRELTTPPDIGSPFGGFTAPTDPWENPEWHKLKP